MSRTTIAPDDTKCGYCDCDLSAPESGATRDHIVPKSLAINAGQASRNLVWCCQTCNRLKGAMMPDALRGMADAHKARASLYEQIADRVDLYIKGRALFPLISKGELNS